MKRKTRTFVEESKPKRYIDQIGKEAVTLHQLIDKIQGSSWEGHRDVTHKQIRLIRKAVNKFLSDMKASDYYYLCSEKWADNYYYNILDHLDKKKRVDQLDSDFLTWLQYQIHGFIRDVFPYYYDGMFRVKDNTFYEKTLKRLIE